MTINTIDFVTNLQPGLRRALCDLLNEHGYAMAVFVWRALDAHVKDAIKTGKDDVFYRGISGPWIDGEVWVECACAVRTALADLEHWERNAP